MTSRSSGSTKAPFVHEEADRQQPIKLPVDFTPPVVVHVCNPRINIVDEQSARSLRSVLLGKGATDRDCTSSCQPAPPTQGQPSPAIVLPSVSPLQNGAMTGGEKDHQAAGPPAGVPSVVARRQEPFSFWQASKWRDLFASGMQSLLRRKDSLPRQEERSSSVSSIAGATSPSTDSTVKADKRYSGEMHQRVAKSNSADAGRASQAAVSVAPAAVPQRSALDEAVFCDVDSLMTESSSSDGGAPSPRSVSDVEEDMVRICDADKKFTGPNPSRTPQQPLFNSSRPPARPVHRVSSSSVSVSRNARNSATISRSRFLPKKDSVVDLTRASSAAIQTCLSDGSITSLLVTPPGSNQPGSMLSVRPVQLPLLPADPPLPLRRSISTSSISSTDSESAPAPPLPQAPVSAPGKAGEMLFMCKLVSDTPIDPSIPIATMDIVSAPEHVRRTLLGDRAAASGSVPAAVERERRPVGTTTAEFPARRGIAPSPAEPKRSECTTQQEKRFPSGADDRLTALSKRQRTGSLEGPNVSVPSDARKPLSGSLSVPSTSSAPQSTARQMSAEPTVPNLNQGTQSAGRPHEDQLQAVIAKISRNHQDWRLVKGAPSNGTTATATAVPAKKRVAPAPAKPRIAPLPAKHLAPPNLDTVQHKNPLDPPTRIAHTPSFVSVRRGDKPDKDKGTTNTLTPESPLSPATLSEPFCTDRNNPNDKRDSTDTTRSASCVGGPQLPATTTTLQSDPMIGAESRQPSSLIQLAPTKEKAGLGLLKKSSVAIAKNGPTPGAVHVARDSRRVAGAGAASSVAARPRPVAASGGVQPPATLPVTAAVDPRGGARPDAARSTDGEVPFRLIPFGPDPDAPRPRGPGLQPVPWAREALAAIARAAEGHKTMQPVPWAGTVAATGSALVGESGCPDSPHPSDPRLSGLQGSLFFKGRRDSAN
ncbi:nascent polypeptide-associated complex subunit alpha, muscle-specific form-like [Paramacrobiotus metropolitanus]|uniref:nascent polypeptide-associated complex subunit alpha, muscle-specific form-like n=1 Tax=Paramacrobiotus metropolitanus TaxID=2943436 RepID=UPI00244634A7|nr:nascent polypeptide-associated complex subunit alpha, muscle-specific form-like [Paramacrobiotus metropolitanus]